MLSPALDTVANDLKVDPDIVMNAATFKRLIRDDGLAVQERREGFEYLATPGNPLRLLGQRTVSDFGSCPRRRRKATNRLSEILQDAELTQGLRQRASQMMIALGKDPTALGQ